MNKETYWEDGGKRITLEDINILLEDIKEIDVEVSTISDFCIHINKTDIDTIDRSERADLSYPIIIISEDNEYKMILDGHHRLLKCIRNGIKTIKAKIINIERYDFLKWILL